MNYKFFLLFLMVSFSFFIFGVNDRSFAQTEASNAASTTLTLPSLFPSLTPIPTKITAFPILEQLDDFASSSVSLNTSSNSGLITTPIASDSAQDYCLNVPIIMYHHVEPLSLATLLGHVQLTIDNHYFEEHIGYFASHQYHFLSLEDLVHAILNRTSVPDKSVVITIDDGYIDNYTYAFLIAKKYHAIINFMIPTGLIGQPDYMTWDHLKEMSQNPYVRIYNHTTSHAPLGLISQNQIIKEVSTANQDLHQQLGVKNDIVVYPYGSYNDLSIQTLQQLGMIAAVSTDPGTNDCLSNIYKLPRVRAGNEPIEDYGY